MLPKSEVSITIAKKADIKTIVDGINNFNLTKLPAQAPTWTPLEFVAKDKHGSPIGGILGGIGYWNGLEIKLLWVDETYRNQGLGTRLLEHMEQAAKTKGAVIAMLDTFDFQAEGFYLKNGYAPIGEIKGFPKGQRRIYFSKRLD
jgi:GNAT superfamily N-acetyltransferase